MRTPTLKQYRLLRVLGNGCVLVVGTRREIGPLIRHGWVTAKDGKDWVRITPEGLRALALAVEAYGWPSVDQHRRRPRDGQGRASRHTTTEGRSL